MQNPSDYVSIGIFALIVGGLGIVIVTLGALFRPKNPYAEKLTPYESGMPQIGSAQQRYTVRYYLVAMLFVVFDIEAIFLYPWAVAFNALGWFGLVEMFLFIALLLVGYAYAWRKGALDWIS